MKLTDLSILKILLSLPAGKLSNRNIFQSMYDNLAIGKIISLSKKQRAWVERVYKEHKLDKKPLAAAFRQKVVVQDKGPEKILDFGPLPMKPPGKS